MKCFTKTWRWHLVRFKSFGMRFALVSNWRSVGLFLESWAYLLYHIHCLRECRVMIVRLDFKVIIVAWLLLYYVVLEILEVGRVSIHACALLFVRSSTHMTCGCHNSWTMILLRHDFISLYLCLRCIFAF